MNIPTNKNEILNTKRTTIIANDIGKLNNPNRGYTQRPFSQYVSRKLKQNKIVFIINVFIIYIKLQKEKLFYKKTYTIAYIDANPKNITNEVMTEGNLCLVVINSARISGKIVVCIP